MGSASQDLTRRARELDRGLARVPAINTGSLLRALGLTFLAFCISPASAAPPTELADSGYLLHAWSTDDGLPENSATAIVQTQDGYLWFGTFNGLVRFNGVTFKVFNPANTPHLPSAGIVNLHADKRDRLWVSTYAGLVMKDGAQWRALGTNEGWAGNYVRTFAERANGDLLITTFDGHVLVAANDRLTELPSPPGEQGQGYLGTVDEDGRWWLAQRRFVGFWNGQEWVQALTPGPSVGRSEVACASARGGGVWVLLAKELVKLRGGTEVSRRSLLEFQRGIWSMSEDRRTNLWICSYDSGLFQLTADGDLHHWTTTDGLGTASMRGIFEDREENLWLGSSGGGLQRLTPGRFFKVNDGSAPLRKTARAVWPARDQGTWLALFDAGLFRYGETGLVRVPVPGPKNESTYGLSVLEDRAGRLWYGDTNYCWWRNGQESFEKVPLRLAVGASITALFEDSKGRVWIGGRGGVVVCEGGGFRQIGPEAGLPGSEIAGFGQEKSGAVWVAGTEGVFREENTGFNEVRTADGQPLRGVLCLKADADGAMWMGTRAAGLLRWRHLRLDRVGAEHGLPDHEVRGILEDEEGYFWMPSSRGIIRARREQLHAVADGTVTRLDCQVLDQHDGLLSDECPPGQPACARDAGGRMWFATQKGVAVIDPAGFRRNSQPPPVHVEQLTYRVPRTRAGQRDREVSGVLGYDEVRLTAPFPLPLRLAPGSYGLEIEYAALSYSAPEKVQYQVRLEGHRPEWEDVRNRSIARFYQMQPGEYVFRVRAANNDGVWNEAGAALAFSVLPFYWQTLWFQGTMGVLLVATGGGAVFWRGRGKRRLELAEMERQKKAFAERRQADERFRLAVEASPNGIVLVNREGRMVLANAHAERMFGYAHGELIGQDVEILVPERFRSEHRGRRTGFFAAPEPLALGFGRELFACRKDGTSFPVEIGLNPIETAEETLVLAAIVDVTERKQREKTLRASEARNASAVDIAGLGFYEMDGDGCVKFMDDRIRELLGVPPSEEVRARDHWLAHIHPEDHPRVVEASRQVLEGELDRFAVEYRYMHPSRGLTWLHHLSRVLARDAGRRATQVIGVIRDITERKQAELALKESGWWLSHTQHIAHVGSWDWDIGTNRRKWSDETCRIFGVASDQSQTTHDAFLERVHPEDRDAVVEAIRRALDEPGIQYSIQHRIVRPDGSERIVHERGEVIRDAQGKPVRMIGSTHDVTERTLAEAESRQLHTELAHLDRVATASVMTSALAHEINQPLAAILSNAQAGQRLLTRGHADLDEIRDLLHDIVQDDKRAGEVIRRLRTMLKRQGPQPEEFELNHVVQEVAGLLHSEVIMRKVSLTMDMAPDPLVICADPVQVQQVILNLLLNALDAVQDKPRTRRKVALSTRLEAGRRVQLTVRDSGPGIPPDRLEAIFDPFYSTKKHGMGLGLAICRSITGMYGGTLVAENVPGGGAQFVLLLPAIGP